MHSIQTSCQAQTTHASTSVPVPVDGSLSNIGDSEKTNDLTSERDLSAAQEVFRNLDVISKVVHVLGKYVGAAAEVGSMLVDVVQVKRMK